ncbi:hypothetical protein CFR73_15095 [Novacetimonas maltaceti]|uniref:Uncharacterized protein n=1 Tax=Novacetimonas maltaceti TaxID=1203393 RepID=A0A2S3VXC9_9PROT|nr:hypothetical protein [Novacetimonas maltaceti]POF61258.1 hypothetical protein KMAL_31160 [Novacetimonas maltaceti]PYD58223.1 hypothetical protein CFR73_15095 [Novacetimonas maltaceti]
MTAETQMERVRAAYNAARKRPNSPYGVLDGQWKKLQTDLNRCRHMEEGLNVTEKQRVPRIRKAALDRAEEFFVRVRDMDPAQFHTLWTPKAPPPPTPQQIAVGLVERLIKRGVDLQISYPSTLVISPASKLGQSERDSISAIKDLVIAEVKRRKDAWVV